MRVILALLAAISVVAAADTQPPVLDGKVYAFGKPMVKKAVAFWTIRATEKALGGVGVDLKSVRVYVDGKKAKRLSFSSSGGEVLIRGHQKLRKKAAKDIPVTIIVADKAGNETCANIVLERDAQNYAKERLRNVSGCEELYSN